MPGTGQAGRACGATARVVVSGVRFWMKTMKALRLTLVRFLAAALVLYAGAACRESAATAVEPAAQPAPAAPPPLEGFVPAEEYTLVLGGEAVAGAELLVSQHLAAFLVLSDRLPAAVMLNARDGTVDRIDGARLERHADGSATLPAAAVLGRVSKLVPGQGEVAFSIEGAVARLRYTPPPSLVGEHRLEEVFEHSPAYRDQASAFAVDHAVVAELRKVAEPIEVRVVFGSWCGVCKSFLPNELRVEQELQGSRFSFVYFGLPAEDPWHHPEVKRLEVKELPTAIVYRDGREVGRFAGADGFRHPETALRDALASAAASR